MNMLPIYTVVSRSSKRRGTNDSSGLDVIIIGLIILIIITLIGCLAFMYQVDQKAQQVTETEKIVSEIDKGENK